ncbi:MAG: BREX-3 system phosphatase PglZ, partial [Chloroflexi bacterium]|nr:BREX-3 system phosphatase PglZ [Chloroflexota bacterium]
PAWAQVAVRDDSLRQAQKDLDEALEAVRSALAAAQDWDAWCAIAWSWAGATALAFSDLAATPASLARYGEVQAELDACFLAWLRDRYTPLAAQRLPTPHHVYHLPHWLAWRRSALASRRVALLVLDGLSLADWVLVRAAWAARHPDWPLDERLLLAQVPTVTGVSRQSLVSGKRPAEFADTLGTTAAEGRHWLSFWAGHDLRGARVAYAGLALDRAPAPPEVFGSHVAALCLVDHSVDDLVHGASLGTAQVQDSLRLWLEDCSPRLEGLIAELLERGFGVCVASDHGHVEAVGMGRPSEGILAESRGQRVRLYRDRRQAENTQTRFPETMVWHGDGLLPEDVCLLLPTTRKAFATWGERMVTHGGVTPDEMMVPCVMVSREDACR